MRDDRRDALVRATLAGAARRLPVRPLPALSVAPLVAPLVTLLLVLSPGSAAASALDPGAPFGEESATGELAQSGERADTPEPGGPEPGAVGSSSGGADAPGTPRPPDELLTLADALAVAQALHPTLAARQAEITVAQARLVQRLAARRPVVTASATYELSVASGVSRVGGSLDVPTDEGPRMEVVTQRFYSLGVSASQRILDFGLTRARVRAAEAEALAAERRALSAELDVLLGVRVAWHEALAAQQLVAVTREAEARARENEAQVRRFVETGLRAPVEQAQAEADVAMAEVAALNAEVAQYEALLLLMEAMGLPDVGALRLADSRPEALLEEELPDEALLALAVEQRPDLQAVRASLLASELTVEAAERAGLPVLNATANLSATGRDDQRIGWSAAVGLRLSWDAYRGGSIRAQADEAAALLAVQEAEERRLVQQLRTDLLAARGRIRATAGALSAADRGVAAARERLRLAEGRYTNGVGSLIEVSDARLGVVQAEGQRIQSELDLAVARVRLFAALGRAW